MARREWARKKALKVWASFRGGLGDYGAQLAYDEHARAVRIVKRALKKASEDKIFARSDAYDGYADACDEILAELQKGRA